MAQLPLLKNLSKTSIIIQTKCYEEICCGTNYIEYILIFYVWQGKVSCFQFSHCNTGKIPSISSPAGGFLDIANIYVWDFKDETYKHDPYRWTPNIRCNCIRFCREILETLYYIILHY